MRSTPDFERRFQMRWLVLSALVFVMMLSAQPVFSAEESGSPLFLEAKPVWAEGRDTEMNLVLGFRGVFEIPDSGAKAALNIACSMYYRAWVNGEFIGHGPARAGHGWFRVDEWDISDRLRPGRNIVAIEVNSPAVNGFGVLDQPGFLQAEVVSDGRVLVATGKEKTGFSARQVVERVQRVQRGPAMAVGARPGCRGRRRRRQRPRRGRALRAVRHRRGRCWRWRCWRWWCRGRRCRWLHRIR